MANKFVTLQEIARLTLPRLYEKLVFPNLVYKDFSNDFRDLGDTIQVRKPVILEAKEFDEAVGTQDQDIKENTVPVKLDKIATVDVSISALEGAVNVSDYNKIFIEPAAVALAQKINSDGLELYKDIPYVCGTPGVTPSDLAALAAVRKTLNRNYVPEDNRKAIWDTEADAAFTTIPAIVNAEKSGSTEALRNGSIGRLFGLDNYMSQAVKVHSKGTLTGTPKPKATTEAGATTLTLSADTLSGTISKGDVLTILGGTYVATAEATAAGNEITVNIYPALKKQVNTNTSVTIAADHAANLAFNPLAFAYVTRPLVKPETGRYK
ncbi:MAG: P22 phage major capsid protein family protein [Bacillota bacterium]|nr:P22 phage major capsid protein family protein [Bacillota bacterium]